MDYKERVITDTITSKGYITAEDISQIYGLSFEGGKSKLMQLVRNNVLSPISGHCFPLRFTYSSDFVTDSETQELLLTA
jgi:hypothetical protein